MQYKLKNSNIEWLGDIPQHWKISKIKRFANIDGGVWGDNSDGENGTKVLRSNDINLNGKWIIENPAIRTLTEKDKIRKRLKLGDLVLVKSSGSKRHIGKTAIVNIDIEKLNCCFSNFTTRIRVNNKILNCKLLWYFINSAFGREQLIFAGTTTTGLINLNASHIGLINIPIPPLNEQQAIADYLDKKCGDIDAIISGRKQQVKQLKNYRQALIFESVTKGLDKTAKLKNSNIEWLGKIPEHWSIKKMSELTTFHVGFTPESKNTEFYGGEHKWITIDDIKNGVVVKNNKRSLSDLGVKGRQDKLTKKGSLLYSFKLTVGKTAFAEEDCYTNEAIASFKPTKKLDMRYFKYSIGDYLINYANENIYGAPLLNDTLIKCARILIPPLNEQQAIADYLDKKCGDIDNTITAFNTQIQQLSDYRKSLIFECITGKKQIFKG
jgi:type I restriction enzyme S subunit